MIIQFMGVPGSETREIANAVAERINGIHLHSENVRSALNKVDNTFSVKEQLEFSRKLGELARFLETFQDQPVVVDYIFGTEESRVAFGDADLLVWVDTVNRENTVWQYEEFFNEPTNYDHKISIVGDAYEDSLPVRAITVIRGFGLFDWKENTVLMIDDYQEITPEKISLYREALKKNTQAVFAVKHNVGMSESNTKFFKEIKEMIYAEIPEAKIIRLPNITNLVYGSNADYNIEEIN